MIPRLSVCHRGNAGSIAVIANETPSPTPIGDHGVVGDLQTLALIGPSGSLDWMCWPRFDSPSLFGRLLDPDGGHWTLEPTHGYHRARQLYLPDTNVLVTRFHCTNGLVEVEDFMAIGHDYRALVRRVRGVRGCVPMTCHVAPRPDYGRSEPKLEQTDRGVVVTADGLPESLILLSNVDVEVDSAGIRASVDVADGDEVIFQLCADDDGTCEIDSGLFDETVKYWRAWIGQTTYRGRWLEIVRRSALTLKLLTHGPTGGLLAAGTTSLPETLGGERNWDYRYVWVRDAAFTVYAFIELGLIDEAAAFIEWVIERVDHCTESDGPPLAPLYDLDGNSAVDEWHLDHWQGYGDSRPIRIGNAASHQMQLDLYGEVIDCLYLADKHSSGLALDTWTQVARLIDWVCDNWDQPDDGMWEVRSGDKRFTSSLLMCWVALERGVRMAHRRGRPADIDRWQDHRDAIHAVILDRGWSDELGAFTQVLDGDTLDASLLLMPLVKFVSPVDPRWLSTLDAIGETLAHDALVDRYDHRVSPDGFDDDEGSFSICSFWYIENLARAGRVTEARLLFEKMLTYAGPLGIHSEVVSPTGDQIGNYPQAFTHLSLISAAVHLDEALDAASARSHLR